MAKQVKNTKVEVPSSTSMNDEDILNDVLLSFKMLVDNLAIAINEASNDHVYKEYMQLFTDTSKMQAKLFETSFKKGWYILEEADESKITQKYDEFSKKESEL